MRIFYYLIVFGFAQSMIAQQLPNLTLYREYQSFLNPAAVPHDYFREDFNAHIGVSYRAQWTRLTQGAPVTGLLQGSYIGDQSNTKLILGGSLVYDKAGAINYYGLNAKFGVLFSEDPLYGGFSAALTLGYKQLRLQTENLIAQDITEILGSSDRFRSSSPDIGFGLFYHARLENEDNFYAGASMPQLFSVNSLNSAAKANIKAIPHYYGIAGYIKYLNDYSFIETSAWVKYVQNIPINADLNIKYQLDQNLWLGVGMSTAKILHLEGGIVLSSANIGWETPLRIGYSFEDGFNQIANPFGKTHEVSISFAWSTR
ncbi:MAG: PorP/SprF family type IX secretion system membrane protein [Saprospiraceae bacterium]|nr:PorP/SprF family type IX secretion system membrane protein [Saprospiraceae bacterium]